MRSLAALLGFLAVSYSAAGLGGAITQKGLRPWYETLRKPAWTPSGSQIGAIWSLLYTLMAVVAFLVWQQGYARASVRRSLGWFGVQLGLNVAWSGLFFGLRRPGLALAEMMLLLGAIVVWLRSTWAIDRRAGVLLLPYVAWVVFASILNAAIWRLNPSSTGNRPESSTPIAAPAD